MISEASLRRDYHAAFLGHLFHRDERSLRFGYELGRRAVVEEVSVLDLAIVHHEVFRQILAETRSDEVDDVIAAASEFFVEVLATYHMTHGAPRT
ncbi:phosphatase RsbU N-terminal domain-containing protein [Microlunatus ginsengisoli]|uniref:Phosphoserine phosphatase RsbU N-terminal domain-containing protein n=1 Tax=Microlunatus ginsengisoli TaxID=363863 RepID=A0ABP7AHQ7_9ACTN